MKSSLRKIGWSGCVAALWTALNLACVEQARAQAAVVFDYSSLVTALDSGVTTITNFQSNATTIISIPQGSSINISNKVTIDAGTNSVFFNGNGAARIFYVYPGAMLKLNNLELANGFSTNGGAIYNAGVLIISNCVLAGNIATNASGAAGASGPSGGQGNGANGGPGGSASGGAIYSTGPVIISYSLLTNNSAEAGNGGNGGYATGGLANGGSAGYGGNAYGGALYTTGSSNVFYMTEFIGNECIAGNGGNGGTFATNAPPFEGAGGPAGLGGSCAGGAVFVKGLLSMSNCLFTANYAAGGSTGAAEVDSNGGGAEGSPGGSAEGGALFITNGAANDSVTNSIFCYNACYGGEGGSTTLTNAIGGTGGLARGGAVWSAAAQVQMGFCTFATNYLFGGPGGTNFAGGSGGNLGVTNGWDIYRSTGVFTVGCSILSGGNSTTNAPNVVGVTDGGYNICSDASLAKTSTTTRLNTNPDLDSGLQIIGTNIVGGSHGSVLPTLDILGGSAQAFVPGVPGLTFPARDETLMPRSTPTCAGAYELSPINPLPTNFSNSAITVTPASNLTGSGDTVVLTATSAAYGFQWLLNSNVISDNANFSGTSSNVLTIKKITISDQGSYVVVVSPSLLEGSVTSSVASVVLTNPPVIKAQPANQLNRPSGSIVSFTLNVGPYPEAYNYQWFFNGTNLPNSSEYSFFNNIGNELIINPATEMDAGTYSVIVSNNYGLKTSGKVRLTIVRDIVRPTIVISNPVVNIRTNSLVIDGLASDNAQVTNVMYWITNINAGLIPATNVQSGYATLSTNGNTNFNSGPNRMLWSITNMPLPGTNILAVQSVDYSSNVSAVVTRRFFYKVPATLMLSNLNVTGSGTLVGRAFIHNDPAPSNQASLNIGEGYSITAVPNSASLLSDWTNTWGTTNVLVTNGNTLKFVMESNTIITASFVSNLFVGIHGAYNGLFYVSPQLVTNIVVTNQVVIPASGTNVATTTNVVSTNSVYTNEVAFASAGMLNNLVLSKPGTFSGRLLLAGGNYGLSGTFNAFGHFSNSVPRPAALGGPLIVELNADTNGVGIITGTVSNAGWETNATLKATLATATPGSTNYTLVVLPMNNAPTNMASPPGYGYALIAEHGGTATLGGHLADGTAFSQTVPMSPSNQVPIYVSLYGRTGFLFGWASLTNTGGTNVQSGLTWIKGTPAHPTALYPDGFTNMLLSASSIWTNPGAITLQPSSVLAVSNADLDLNYAAGIEDNDKLVNTAGTPANSLSGTINLKTGFLQVIFGNGDGNATTRGYGAMLQSTTNAGGYFVTKTNAGSITLGLTNEPPVGSSTPVSDLETNSSNVGPYQYIGVGLESFSLERFK